MLTFPTTTELAAASSAALVGIFNKYLPYAGLTNVDLVKRFATRADGLRRVEKVLAAARSITARAAEQDQLKVASAWSTTGKRSEATLEQLVKLPTAAAPVEAKQPTNVAAAIRSLIAAGKTNAEIWAIVQPQFNLLASKKGYPAWYRAEAARKAARA